MEKYIFPWKSEFMLSDPLIFPIYLLILGILFTGITWYRKDKNF